jgi:AcrR family transcriptional regulator
MAEKRPAARRGTYHHGNLRAALIEATLALVEEEGPEKVSVREAAKRAGVSSGAPFRHFSNRTALLTAVAEEAMTRLLAEIDKTLAENAELDPLQRFRALGTAYLRWVMRNPTHFQVISNRKLIDFDGSKTLRRDNEGLKDLMDGLLHEAQRAGLLRSDDLSRIPLAGRALAYGLARMYVDGHFPLWDVKSRGTAKALQAAFDVFIAGLARERKK